MDEFQNYLLDQIEQNRKDIKEEPECEYAVGALVQALTKYTSLKSIQG